MAAPRKSGSPLHIALAFPVAQAHLQALTQGITAYAKDHGRWVLTTGGEAGTLSIEQLEGWRGQGIIAALIRPSEAQAAHRFMRAGVPVVTIAGALLRPGLPRVTVSNVAIGRLAAEHLLKCGFRHFAFYGLRRAAYSADRQKGFVARLAEAGHRCTTHFSTGPYSRPRGWQNDVGALCQWLLHLPRPTGVFAVNDYRARLVIDACDWAALEVPAQVGVIGVDNDPMLCEFSQPGLSSIDCDWHEVGVAAARTLHAMLRGQRVDPEQRIVPRGIVRRASTTATRADDPRLDKVLTYLHEHLEEVFGVERLLAACDISRRTLEQVFRAELGMTPYLYLCKQRVERAKALLAAYPTASLKEIGRQCGFRDVPRFRQVFTRLEGRTPAAYRARRGSTARDIGVPPIEAR